PGLGGDEKLQKSIYSLEKGEISEVIEHEGKFYIVQIIDSKDSRIPEISEVSDQVQKDFIEDLSLVAAEEKAKGYLKELNEGADWSGLAKKEGLKTDETGFFSRGGEIPKVGYSPVLSEAAFALSPEKNYPDQGVEIDGKVYIIKWLDKKGVGIDDFNNDKEKEGFKQALLSARHGRLFAAWLQSLKDKSEIKIVTSL
ncbi:MAG TPA: peptidyl-prolyl cis-trans isomerase, partial [Desulfatiglandales bacterium]|nr:peptidyl-prolyl cis-trans isomerase [Desulfatiglandales bacterium]